MVHEWITLKSTLHILDNAEFNCGECQHKYKSKPAHFEAKGCSKLTTVPVHKVDNIRYKTCIGNLFSYSDMHWIRMFGHYDKSGALPFPGTILEQPAKVLDIYRVIEDHNTERMINLQKKSRLEQKTKGAARGRR